MEDRYREAVQAIASEIAGTLIEVRFEVARDLPGQSKDTERDALIAKLRSSGKVFADMTHEELRETIPVLYRLYGLINDELERIKRESEKNSKNTEKLERLCGKLLRDDIDQDDGKYRLVSTYYEHKALRKFQEEHKARHPDEAFPEVIPRTETHELLVVVLDYLASGIAFQLEWPPDFNRAIAALRENEGLITELREAVEQSKEFHDRLMGRGETFVGDEIAAILTKDDESEDEQG
jgi:hypothetical protein